MGRSFEEINAEGAVRGSATAAGSRSGVMKEGFSSGWASHCEGRGGG